MLTGENGILTQARRAKTETESAEEDELRRLTALEATTNLENTTYKDKNNQTVTIPAGFAVSKVEGENTIEDGLVIIDKNGNEFVWVPVNKDDFEIQFVRREGYSNGIEQTHLLEAGEADDTGINTNYNESEITQQEAKNMYNSVKKNEGFYIGRYEAGKDTNGRVVLKKGADVYNNVKWSANGEMQETQNVDGGAIELARNFYKSNNWKEKRL